MNTDVGVARWRELIDAFLVQRERLVRIHPALYEMSRPNPGATEEQLVAAEERLGHAIPAQNRQFLTVANGWKDWNQSSALLSSDEIGAGVLSAEEFAVMIEGDPREWHGYDEWIQIAASDAGYWSTYLLCRDSQGEAAGTVVPWPHADRFHESFEQYLVDELASLTEWLDGEELGPHGRYWGRDLRVDPPTMRDIVERLAALRAELAQLQGWPIPEPPNPGAAPSDLEALEGRLGRTLHPEHREFLEIADGVPGHPHYLSAAEIISGEPWTRALAERDRHNWPAPSIQSAGETPWHNLTFAAEFAERAGVTPFATQVMVAYGVDPEDGLVRAVVDDTKYMGTSGVSSRGTVREHLLSEIDALSGQVEALRG
ncbi:SMI1/KNR4 family protein [Tsukamurella paurometabola]|uniref:SMI1/KNR4 family protein n=1 Tax=Tsukamurella paurometabola TaxID=2061 RepID=A0ABS5NB41_TSUPA|nr:SMI1/KNR4 family protein [Tsukamurella paurometabola]MBS4101504.1 SMI1/KNR4 family protein [Tsukamurella paurometabola]